MKKSLIYFSLRLSIIQIPTKGLHFPHTAKMRAQCILLSGRQVSAGELCLRSEPAASALSQGGMLAARVWCSAEDGSPGSWGSWMSAQISIMPRLLPAFLSGNCVAPADKPYLCLPALSWDRVPWFWERCCLKERSSRSLLSTFTPTLKANYYKAYYYFYNK